MPSWGGVRAEDHAWAQGRHCMKAPRCSDPDARVVAQPGCGLEIGTMRERPEGQGSSLKQLGPATGNPQ